MGPFYAVLAGIAVVFAVFIFQQMSQAEPEVKSVDPNAPLPTAEGYLMGSPTAPVQVVEYADFECPACANFATITEPDVRKRLVETGRIAFRFMDFPLEGHRNSWPASHAAACASEQGKFWEMHDRIFDTQDQWNTGSTSRPKGVFEGLAREIGLDVAKWEECYDSQKYRLNIAANQRQGLERAVGQTPTFIIGSKMIPGSISFDTFRAYVDSAAAAATPAAAAAKDTL